MIQRLTSTVAVSVALIATTFTVHAQSVPERIDSLSGSVESLESKVLSTLVFGGSSPVSFSGEARLKMQLHNFNVYPDFIAQDRSYLQSGWEGNENMFRLGMIVRPGRNTVLWAKMGLQHTLTGEPRVTSEDRTAFSRHDKANNSATIHEDMSAGIAVRTIPASFWLRMGNVQWIEASPLTIWKAQPRTFAWEYLPFEVEQPISRYYEYNIARGEKSGRAAWNKKAFNGINFESINLPSDLYFNFVYGSFERYDNFEREYLDFSNDLAYAGDGDLAIKGTGIGDAYRKAIHARLAKQRLIGNMALGVNYVGINYSDDIVHVGSGSANGNLFDKAFSIGRWAPTDPLAVREAFNYEYDEDGTLTSIGRGFYKEPKVFSLDLRGPISDNVSILADIGLSRVDTTWMITDASGDFTRKEFGSTPFIPAFYSKIDVNKGLPFELDLAYFAEGFYSPFSFSVPMDAFYAFGSNLVGAGKFIARGEGSPYAQNMAGAQITLKPDLGGYGHFKVKYGQHFQLEAGKDVLFFPYRLNGYDMFSFFHTSYNRWGNGLIDHSLSGKYSKRLGDESFRLRQEYGEPHGPHAGGLRSDYLSFFEGFAAFDTEMEVEANRLYGTPPNYLNPYAPSMFSEEAVYVRGGDTLHTTSSFVPMNQKFTFNLEADIAYDISKFVGYKNDLFVGGYAAINGVSRSFKPLAFSDETEDMLLWSFYLRLEPAIALNNNFYILGLAGYENWRSQKSWMRINGENVLVPINHIDMAFGLGFDWDILERVGLHGRAKWMSHTDSEFEDNNWQTPVVSFEIKTWF